MLTHLCMLAEKDNAVNYIIITKENLKHISPVRL